MDYETLVSRLKFDEKGLIPVVVQDYVTHEVLTLAYMNRESLKITLEEKRTCFYSRSRQCLWRKGETSGNVQTLGKKPDGSDWNIAVQDPNDTGSYLGYLTVGETAVITSGSYQRFFTEGGQKYHHILSPKTGRPVNNGLLSVTIVCEDGTLADCLSTAMFVLGPQAALNYWRTYGGFEMIMVTSDNRIICTKGLIEKFTLSNQSYTLSFSE